MGALARCTGRVGRSHGTTGMADGANPADGVGAGVAAIDGASSLYMTGVTRRAMSVLLTNPPMMTHASGE